MLEFHYIERGILIVVSLLGTRRTAPVSYWSIFPLSLLTVPEDFANAHSAQLTLVSKLANMGELHTV